MATTQFFVVKDDVRITKQQKVQHNFVPEDGRLKFDFMTSLQKMTMAKIVSHLWMDRKIQKEIQDLIKPNMLQYADFWGNETRRILSQWQQIENNVLTKASQLYLPDVVINLKLKEIILPFGTDIYNWIRCHDHLFDSQNHSKYFAVDYINHIKWNCRGIIDYPQTAKSILDRKGNELSNDHKFKLACVNCLEDEITIIAPNVITKKYLNSVAIRDLPMVHFWTTHITGHDAGGDRRQTITRHEYFIRLLANCPIYENEGAIKYMWNKLNEEERNGNIRILVYKLNTEFTFSLLSIMNYWQQQELFKNKYFYYKLGALLGWLWEDYFLPTALHALHVMHPKCYFWIIHDVALNILHSKEGHEHMHNWYKSIFKELWQKAPKTLKNFALNYKNGRGVQCLIFLLSWQNDIDVIELILSDTSVQQRRQLILEGRGIKKCRNFVLGDQWDSLNMFIEHTLFSVEDIAELKRRLVCYKRHNIIKNFILQKAWDKIEYFMKWALESDEVIDTNFSDQIYLSSSEDDIDSSFSEEEINAISSDEEINAISSDEEINAISSDEEINAISSDEEINASSSEEEINTSSSEEEINTSSSEEN